MKPWLRSNRWYLAALAALVPAAILVALNAGWFAYVEGETGQPIVVDGSETVEYSGAKWALLEWRAVAAGTDAGEEADLLPGTTLITATIGVRPGEAAPACTVQLTDAAGIRSWDEAGFDETSYEVRSDSENYCDSNATEPYKLEVFFVVPDDAAADARLTLQSPDEYPALLVFEL